MANKKILIIIPCVIVLLAAMFIVGAAARAWYTPHTLAVTTLYPLGTDVWYLNEKPVAIGRGFCATNMHEPWSVKLERAGSGAGTLTIRPEFSLRHGFPFVKLVTRSPEGFNLGMQSTDVALDPALRAQFSCPPEK